jgi:hypothetical protein
VIGLLAGLVDVGNSELNGVKSEYITKILSPHADYSDVGQPIVARPLSQQENMVTMDQAPPHTEKDGELYDYISVADVEEMADHQGECC